MAVLLEHLHIKDSVPIQTHTATIMLNNQHRPQHTHTRVRAESHMHAHAKPTAVLQNRAIAAQQSKLYMCKTQLLPPSEPVLGCLYTTQVPKSCADKSYWGARDSNLSRSQRGCGARSSQHH